MHVATRVSFTESWSYSAVPVDNNTLLQSQLHIA